MATTVTKIVDPDNGTGTDYTSLSAWEAGMQKDLVSADEISVAKCRCTGGTADTTAFSINGWTTDATRYIKIWTDPSEGYRHSGTYPSGNKYRFEVTNQDGFSICEEYVRVDGIALQLTKSNTSVHWLISTQCGDTADNRISNFVLKGVCSSTGSACGLVCWSGVQKAWNGIIYDFSNAGGACMGAYGRNTTINWYNLTIVACDHGILSAYGNVYCYNILSYNNVDNYDGGGGTNNLSGPSQTDAPGTSARQGVTVTFVDYDNRDLHLAAADAGAKDYGVSDPGSGLFSDDIDGVTRTGTWDIGADEYVAAAAGQPTIKRWGGVPGMAINRGVW